MLALTTLFILSALPAGDILIQPEQLESMADVLPVDARTPEAFENGHLPGAVNLDARLLGEERKGVKNLVPDAMILRKTFADHGIDPQKHIVVYTRWETVWDMKSAARLFWVLEYMGYPRVSFLDGGLNRWENAGQPLETGPAEPALLLNGHPAVAALRPHPDRIATRCRVLDTLENQEGKVVDVRPAACYSGETIDEEFVQRRGHIPGALNLPAAAFFRADGRFLNTAAMASKLQQAQYVKRDPVIVYCNTAMSGSLGYLIFRIAGYDAVRVYDGAMAEWSAHPALALTTE
jgi:thiosulfate/3-mercaptopyruvate sulfurtransferase